jgi:FO synthase
MDDFLRLQNLSAEEIDSVLADISIDALMDHAERLTIQAHGSQLTYSRKVFIPLTKLCRDVCHYCTFATTPHKAGQAYLTREEVLAIARAGKEAGCREALFTLGDQPERRYAAAREGLEALGHASTLSYLGEMARAVIDETGLLPHLNPGLMDGDDYAMLRPHAVSMGLMLESTADRLCERGGPHHGSPDKHPDKRLAAIEEAGKARVPFTTGLLIGIGETRAERIQALVAIRELHRRYGHIQEVIVQNFCPKPGTRMADHPEPPFAEHIWTIAVARLILGPEMTLQAPPNLRKPDELHSLARAGINDWGGVSPVTPDHVNPEAPWPHLDELAAATAAMGRVLVERLGIGPAFVREADRWLDPGLALPVVRSVDARGLPVVEAWRAGGEIGPPELIATGVTCMSAKIDRIIEQASLGQRLSEADIVALFAADGPDVARITRAADRLRSQVSGEAVTYVVNRNINYTNICLYRCAFCAFSKGGTRDLRGPAYDLDEAEIGRRAAEAWGRGATEVCLQGGIHPRFDGHTYHRVLKAVRDAAPDIHIHAFSPLEVTHGARTLGMSLSDYLAWLKEAGLSTLPGTAAEILDPEVRAIICPDKVSASEWIEVMRAAHGQGLHTTATIMFGHVDAYEHWARHLLLIRDLQEETGGFTEFVPLPFVHMEAPMWRKGRSRSGPSFRETLLMHAVARLVLHTRIDNIQASWVKLGPEGARQALHAGANDLGGVLMDESITRAAGGRNGQIFGVEQMHELARRAGRPACQRTTVYGRVAASCPETVPETVGA